MSTPAPGQIGWFDLTTEKAESLRSFYEKVVGWSSEPVDMDGYSDYCMKPVGADNPVAGICHARGANAALPPQWLLYITVADLDYSLSECRNQGGEVIAPIRQTGSGKFAVIRDPAGAVCALFEAASDSNSTH
jgi:predicted enzyme related to lactoylglutathione lyase